MASYSGMMWMKRESGKAGIGTAQPELPLDTQLEMTREQYMGEPDGDKNCRALTPAALVQETLAKQWVAFCLPAGAQTSRSSTLRCFQMHKPFNLMSTHR